MWITLRWGHIDPFTKEFFPKGRVTINIEKIAAVVEEDDQPGLSTIHIVGAYPNKLAIDCSREDISKILNIAKVAPELVDHSRIDVFREVAHGCRS